MIRFIRSNGPELGIAKLSCEIIRALKAGKRVLWLIAGGSNIPIAVKIEQEVRRSVATDELLRLTVSETDERYGPIGHKDSNWMQMIEAGFDFDGATFMPILRDKSLGETVEGFAAEIESVFKSADVIVGQFGIGADGHIAGLLPHSPALNDKTEVSGYESKPFTRISLTPGMIEKINVAYLFAFGASKKEALLDLKNKDLSLDEEPAQILKKLPQVTAYSDQSL